MAKKTLFLSGGGWIACAAVVLLRINLGQAEAAAINAASVSFADVRSAVASASDGDTVVIPAGTASWTSALRVTKAITLQGQTTVSGDHTGTMSANDQTIIRDDIPRSGNAWYLWFQPTAGTNARITGITFRYGATVTTVNENFAGLILIGSSSQVRVDHCHFDGLYQAQNVTVSGSVYGVIDHCVFDEGAPFTEAILANNGGSPYGDQAWAAAAGFGGPNFIFYEDDTFNGNGVGVGYSLDSCSGGRYVARYCTFVNSKASSHGTETSGRQRSTRAIEVYNNTFTAPHGQGWGGPQLRGGTQLLHDNTYVNYDPTSTALGLRIYRMFSVNIWPQANGTSGWDSNDSHGVYESGTVTTGSSGSTGTATFTDNTKSWTTNQWIGYVIRNTTSPRVHGTYIMSNTATTIKFWNQDGGSGNPIPFNTGDAYEIRKVLIALDQPGRGQGDLLSGDRPGQVDSTCNCVHWPNQALEPVYAWNNTLNGHYYPIGTYGEPTLVSSRDYYNSTPMPGYAPYTYPHPLATGGGDGPGTPQRLHVVQ